MYSTYNEGKPVVAERFIRTLKNKIFKNMTAISKMFILMCWLPVLSWQSKGLSNENIDPPTTSLSSSINYVGNKIRVIFTGSCLKQSNKFTYTHKK